MSRTISEISSIASTYKSLHVIYSPTLDCIYSASLLLRVLRDVEAEVQLAPFYSAQKPISSTAILGIGVMQRAGLSGSRFFLMDDFIGKDPKSFQSYSLHLLKTVKSTRIVPKPIEILAISSMLSLSRWSLYDERLLEAHKSTLAEAVSSELWEYTATLRLFGYPKRSLALALERTVDPFIPGVSFDSEGCRRIVEMVGDKLDDKGREKLIGELDRILSTYLKSVPPLHGEKIVAKNVDGFDDPYEMVYALYTYMDLKGPDPLLYLCLDNSMLDIAIGKYVSTFKTFKDLVDEIIKGQNVRRVIVKGVRLGMIDISSEKSIPPLYTIHKILRAIGIADELSIYVHGSEYLLPLQFIEPRWPFDKELNIERNYTVFSSLQDVGDVVH
ncbi:MAG: hypothetical protein N3D82_04965 [Ignisphaera sp.]|nr:hypothetical protein [Ignisphaera sp.]MCX8168359.1 hypothetical protein [Ignisphaera sp.]MDW8086199.1 hypothetical protein [Ignisphaera sp.]